MVFLKRILTVTLIAGQLFVPVSYAGTSASVTIKVTVIDSSRPMFSVVTADGYRLMVQKRLADGTLAPAEPYIMKGVCWSPTSHGTPGPEGGEANENDMRKQFSLWCDTDLPLIKQMNANTVRVYMDFGLDNDYAPKNWKYVLDKCYENGIMVILSVDRCVADTVRIDQVVSQYKNHPAMLMWQIGNEWNIPNRWGYFYGAYKTFDEAIAAAEACAKQVKSLDPNHPVVSSYGEPNMPDFVTTEDIIRNKCPSFDVWAFNIFRGRTVTNLYDQWKDALQGLNPKPMFVGEFGCDAYDSSSNQENTTDQRTWEYYQWDDIRKNLSGEDASKVCVGGCVFDFIDEWWKAGNQDVHDTGGWITNNCPDGFGSEEWWGLCDRDRNPRPAYDLFKEFYGGQEPEPPPANTQEDYNVVRFSTQPDTITTNISTYIIADVFKDASEVDINGQAVPPDYYFGFANNVTLTAGANNFTMDVKFKDGTGKSYQKTVIYDPNYSTAGKKLVYVNDIVIDIDAGACIGRLPAAVTAITHDCKFFTDKNANVYSTANNQFTGKKLNLNTSLLHYPVFSNDDATVYSHAQALDVATNNILNNSLPVDVTNSQCSLDSSGYIYYGFGGTLKKIDPVTFAVVDDLSNAPGWWAGDFCVSRDGALAFGTQIPGPLNVMDITAAVNTQLWAYSDWEGNVVQSTDGSKTFLGTYGNSWYGKGGLYVIDNNTKTLGDFYHQFGARRLAVSPDNIFTTSIVVDHHFVDPNIPLGQVIQGSIYHRGVEVFSLNAQSKIEYRKSYFLAISHDYNLPVKVFYKRDY